MDEATQELLFVSRRMFGGLGYFAPNGGIFAAIVTHDDLVLKFVLGPERNELVALGGAPWVYEGSPRSITMQEWLVVPEAFYDDVELLKHWVGRAHRAAPPKKKRTKARPPKSIPPPKPAETAARSKAGLKARAEPQVAATAKGEPKTKAKAKAKPAAGVTRTAQANPKRK
jgi:TfoX/Sxy family transcriptional regulator of competence genes